MTTAGFDRILSTAHRAHLVRLCAAVSGSRQAAEDLAQEALLEAWRNQDKLTEPSGADRWLAAIARNVCRRWLRRQGLEAASVVPRASSLDTTSDRAAVGAEAERIELRSLLDSARSSLPATTRDVLIHRYVHDACHAEIGSRFGLSAEATAMRASRGRAALRAALGPQLQGTDGARQSTIEAPAAGWVSTGVWCTSCGRSTLAMCQDIAASTVAFRCLDARLGREMSVTRIASTPRCCATSWVTSAVRLRP